jgi:hypothetical protein
MLTSFSDPFLDWSQIKARPVDQDPVPDFRIMIQARKNELQKKKKGEKLHVLICCLGAGFRIRIRHFS